VQDPNRIGHVLQTLRVAWELTPDLPLGQLLIDSVSAHQGRPRTHVSDLEDEEIDAALAAWPTLSGAGSAARGGRDGRPATASAARSHSRSP
jgi:hypothetical protein